MYKIHNKNLRMCSWLFNTICIILSITTNMGYVSICGLQPFCVVIEIRSWLIRPWIKIPK